MKFTLFALGMGASILMTGQALADPAPAAPAVLPVSTEAVPVAAPKADPKPEKIVKVCHNEEVSGSMIPKRVCR